MGISKFPNLRNLAIGHRPKACRPRISPSTAEGGKANSGPRLVVGTPTSRMFRNQQGKEEPARNGLPSFLFLIGKKRGQRMSPQALGETDMIQMMETAKR
jgi:hypothetical protein